MLSRNGLSKRNTKVSFSSLLEVKTITRSELELKGGQYFVEQTKTVVHIEHEDMSLGLYLMEHDTVYIVDRCFHMKIYWIYARGPTV
jgi:hypothetical protein